jgi:hypothetical protein
MKKIIFIVTFAFFGTVAYSQSFVDNALLFSRTKSAGSARIQGLGGTQTSLGGDYSSALSNPAGLGMFNRNEFTFSTAISSQNSRSDYFGTTSKDSKTVFNIPGLSLVINLPSRNETGFLGGSLGISLTRINDFNLNTKLAGSNANNSIVDYFIQDAGDLDPDAFLDENDNAFYSLTGLAYRNYLIEDFSDAQGYYYDSKLLFNRSFQQEISQRRGAQYQWSIAYGANFADKLFVGASLGLTTLRFKLSQWYSETDLEYPEGIEEPLNDLSLNENYDISGSGVNFTLGAIYRPVNFVQLGVSFVTPTYYQITDSYTARVETNWNNYDYYPDDPDDDRLNNVYEELTQPLISEYALSTPLKLSTGATFISKFGFISTDVEFVNYQKARYSSDIADDFSAENSGIKEEYKKVINYRVGAEYRYSKLRVRGGFNYMNDPVKTSTTNFSQHAYSGGLGYRDKEFYIDFAATLSFYKGMRVPYFVSGGVDPVAEQKFRTSNFLITLGFPF